MIQVHGQAYLGLLEGLKPQTPRGVPGPVGRVGGGAEWCDPPDSPGSAGGLRGASCTSRVKRHLTPLFPLFSFNPPVHPRALGRRLIPTPFCCPVSALTLSPSETSWHLGRPLLVSSGDDTQPMCGALLLEQVSKWTNGGAAKEVSHQSHASHYPKTDAQALTRWELGS